MNPYSKQHIDQSDIDAVVEVLKGTHLTQGPKVKAYEAALQSYLGIKHAITFNSATSALHASYLSIGASDQDQFITSPISFAATSNMIIETGATPVFSDIKLDGTLDERIIEKQITDRTKAIVPVDYAGNPSALKGIVALAKKHNLYVIEDAAHALGSEIEGKKVGTFSDITVFSTHAIKPIATGEGGIAVTDDDVLAEKLRLYSSHGIVKKKLWNNDMVQMGYNYRLTDIQAALGLSQLTKLDTFIQQRNEIATYYDHTFNGHKLFGPISVPEGVRSSRHLYPILLSPSLFCSKEEIFTQLLDHDIGVQVHYKPIYNYSYYTSYNATCPTAESFYKAELSIPCHQEMSMSDAEKTANTLLKIFDTYKQRGQTF